MEVDLGHPIVFRHHRRQCVLCRTRDFESRANSLAIVPRVCRVGPAGNRDHTHVRICHNILVAGGFDGPDIGGSYTRHCLVPAGGAFLRLSAGPESARSDPRCLESLSQVHGVHRAKNRGAFRLPARLSQSHAEGSLSSVPGRLLHHHRRHPHPGSRRLHHRLHHEDAPRGGGLRSLPDSVPEIPCR